MPLDTIQRNKLRRSGAKTTEPFTFLVPYQNGKSAQEVLFGMLRATRSRAAVVFALHRISAL